MRALVIGIGCILVLPLSGCAGGARLPLAGVRAPSSASAPAEPRDSDPRSPSASGASTGKASYYGGRFHGRRTASGARFDQNAMTAAHRTLPFGTLLRVTNLSNRRSVLVRVTDRGPFVGGRIIDLSRAAARQLGFFRKGITEVRLEPLKH